eukprot:CAMPEP_0197717450 /NCGR_PEP_ID=MMETSP1434-20131217/1978_1 /TAXON_ID=265543 /ORGANISM="Minutocellus polymorphus, Strain CCMP3303" /LENGTH=382 /DNA_ID=CAMNT_0043301979 /DNA_START=119 /DNA_END=1267 /DNA_ORIENTATION=-
MRLQQQQLLRRRPARGGARDTPPKSFLSPPLKQRVVENNDDDDDDDDACTDDRLEKSDKIATEALQSIKFCYRACFAAFLADAFVSIIDDKLWAKWFGGGGGITWTDWVDLLDTLNVLIFGLGLRRVSQLYFATLQDRDRRMSEESVLDLMRTMSKIWRSCALSLGLVSLSMATSLHQQGGVALRIGAGSFVVVVLAVLALGNGIIRHYCSTKIKALTVPGDNTSSRSEARELGYRAYRNQALCAGVFAIMSAIEFIKWVANKAEAGIVGRVFAIPDFLTPAAITTLLFALNKSFLPAFVVATRAGVGAVREGDIDDEIYDQLFTAQKDFYTKIGATLESAAIFRVLPYVVTPLLPYLLRVIEAIAPPPMAEKILSTFGLRD